MGLKCCFLGNGFLLLSKIEVFNRQNRVLLRHCRKTGEKVHGTIGDSNPRLQRVRRVEDHRSYRLSHDGFARRLVKNLELGPGSGSQPSPQEVPNMNLYSSAIRRGLPMT